MKYEIQHALVIIMQNLFRVCIYEGKNCKQNMEIVPTNTNLAH